MKVPAYSKNFPWEIIEQYSKYYEIDKLLIASVIMVESGGNQFAIRYEPDFKYLHEISLWSQRWVVSYSTCKILQQCSYGLMQIMGATAMDLGLKDIPTNLFDIEKNIKYGTKVLKEKSKEWGNDPLDIYAAYNAGTIRKTVRGLYLNQWNVTKFEKIYTEFTSSDKTLMVEI